MIKTLMVFKTETAASNAKFKMAAFNSKVFGGELLDNFEKVNVKNIYSFPNFSVRFFHVLKQHIIT